MKKPLLTCCYLLIMAFAARAQDTFSIVAVDSVTGEIGSAGASCLGYTKPIVPFGCLIISDIIPGVGAIHTQAQWDPGNQKYAHSLMDNGMMPNDIISSLKANDATGDSSIRQYGIVLFHNGHPVTGAYTGSGCPDYKNHILGKYYSIQGNTLLGPKVLDSIQARFLRTRGPMADRLMAALQGAKMIGADVRCNQHGTSTLSAFIRVAKPTDDTAGLYINIHMSYDNNVSGTLKVDPIDSLQHMFARARAGMPQHDPMQYGRIFYRDNIPYLTLGGFYRPGVYAVYIYDLQGRQLSCIAMTGSAMPLMPASQPAGLYLYKICENNIPVQTGKLIHP